MTKINVVASYLQNNGFRTLEADTGSAALQTVRNTPVDLIILDLMPPDFSGEEVCRIIRRISSVPILMLTAKVTGENRIHSLSIGADDYMIKPFDPSELVARVRAVLRRSDDVHLLADRISFHDGELTIDSVRHEVIFRSQPVNLTPSEFKLLLLLARHPQRPFSREELAEKVMGFDFDGDMRAIDQHIKNLRQNIEPDPRQPKYIATVYGSGYRFIGGA